MFAVRDSRFLAAALVCVAAVLLSSCSATKFLNDEETLLADVDVRSAAKTVDASSFESLVRQHPNARWFSLFKVPLGVYCLSGRDTARASGRFWRNLGEAPVVFRPDQVATTQKLMQQALVNRGYLHARVEARVSTRRRRTRVCYTLQPGRIYTIERIDRFYDNALVDSIISADSTHSQLYRGMPCNADRLEAERTRIATLLQNHGFYGANKDLVSFVADTLAGSAVVDLTVNVRHQGNAADSARQMRQYVVGRVRVACDESGEGGAQPDSMNYEGYNIVYQGRRPRLKPKRIAHNMALSEGKTYRTDDVQRTYRNLARLPIVLYTGTTFKPSLADSARLDCNVALRTQDINSLSFELEGTNTSGDLGAAAVATYANRNLFRGGELLSLRLRGAFEAITGLEGYSDQNYFGISLETSLKFPHFVCPFFDSYLKRTSRITTEATLMYDSQNRPEFHRRVLTAAWRYRWASWGRKMTHTYDLLSVNYVFMPWISDNFRRQYLDSVANARQSVLRYSYENLLIARTGYSFTYNSLGSQLTPLGLYHTNAYQLKFNIETAGNLLYALAHAFNMPTDGLGHRTVFNVAFAQYAKCDLDYARSFLIDDRNSLAFHSAVGVVVPYGNASVVPYEKRYFAGGANSVRGWGVRELGPGRFGGRDGRVDFINQTGNLKLDLSLELRTFLFWKLHGALFVDAGNIWTLRKYPEQPGGEFRFDKFLEQIAVAYGMGFRFNFDYLVLRFDMGMKAINPAFTDARRHYPAVRPRLSRDFAFHFAVGMPF